MNKLGKIVFALTVVGSIGFVACGGDDSGATPDAGSGSGSGSQTEATVKTVSCTGATIAATVTDPGFLYVSSPAGSGGSNESDVPVNGIVEFNLVPAMDHPVGPDSSGPTDSGLVAADGAVTCLQFTAAGTFDYHCTVHLFKGKVIVK